MNLWILRKGNKGERQSGGMQEFRIPTTDTRDEGGSTEMYGNPESTIALLMRLLVQESSDGNVHFVGIR